MPSSRKGSKWKNRATPYSTSQRRNKASIPNFLPNHTPTSDQLDVIEFLLSKSWRLYRTSPLWHFNTSTAKLHTYSEELSRHLLATPSLESGYGAKVKPLPRFGLDASTAVRIDVHRNNTQQDSTEAVLILCRVKPPLLSPGRGFVSMPLLLNHGPLKLIEPVVKWLGSTFDSFISPFTLTQEDLLMLAGHYANADLVSRSKGNIELVYSTSSAVKKAGLSTVSVEVPRESVETMWNVASSKVKGEGGELQVKEAFLSMIDTVVNSGTSLELKSFVLTRISTRAMHADASGLVKFLCHEVPVPVLAVLQSTWENSN